MAKVRAMRRSSKLAGDDTFGEEVWAHLNGAPAFEMLEREDGTIGLTRGPAIYFEEFVQWQPHQQQAMDVVYGSVLDAGAGAGRFALHLQQQGFEVTAIDNSPLAVRVCKKRGVRRAKVASLRDMDASAQIFDTVLLLGGNFGLVESPKRAPAVLALLHRITSDGARLIAESVDPYHPAVPDHLTYARAPHRVRRWAGEIRMRLRYKRFIGEWFDYLLVSKEEMRALLDGSGWRIQSFLDSGQASYVAVIEKSGAAPRRVRQPGGRTPARTKRSISPKAR